MIQTVLNSKLFWAKGNESVIIPTKRDEDGGYDIYANFKEDYMIIPPHTTKFIPTDLYCAFSSDYIMILKERGSTGVKGMGQRAGVIDSGFRKSIGVPLTNTNDMPIAICKNIDKEIPDELIYKTGLINALIKNMRKLFKKPAYIKYPYTKAICQAVIVPLAQLESSEISVEELKQIPSERGSGMLGSSGK